MSDSRRITNETKSIRSVEKGSRRTRECRSQRLYWRGVLLSFALKHHGHDYFIAEIDCLGRIV
jgi:hypothetical protein